MARYHIALVAIVLLLIVQDGLCYKQKNEHKKTKGSKYKNKVSGEVKNHGQRNQHHHYRPTRSVEAEKYKVDENIEEKIPYIVDRPRKGGQTIEETTNEYETSCPKRSAKSCSMRQESGLTEKKKKKACYVMVEEEEGVGELPIERTKTKKHHSRQETDTKKIKNMKKKQSYVLVEEEPETAPEDIEYKVIVNKRAKRKVMPTYIYVDEIGDESMLTEDSTFPSKSLKKKSGNYIIDESEMENRTGRRYILEDMLDHTADEEGNGLDEEEENETI